MEYEPAPTPADLASVGRCIGQPVSVVRRIHGGQSATTDILEAQDGTRLTLRRHGRWSIGFDDGIAEREATVLRAAAEAGVPVPAVQWSGRFGRATALITQFVEGEAVIDPADPVVWASQLAVILTAIHAVPITPDLAQSLTAAPPGPVDLATPERFFAHPRANALLERRAALASQVGDATSLIHGDYWPGNLLWREGAIVAVLDWEAAVVGDPASDVAYCFAELHYLGLPDAADHFVGTYRDITGSELASLPYWTVTALCRAVPELDSYLNGWSALGYRPAVDAVQRRLDRLIETSLQ